MYFRNRTFCLIFSFLFSVAMLSGVVAFSEEFFDLSWGFSEKNQYYDIRYYNIDKMSSSEIEKLCRDHGKTVKGLPVQAAYMASLTALDNDRLSVKIILCPEKLLTSGLKENKFSRPELAAMILEQEDSVQMRGEVLRSGVVSSFWVQSTQKNLLSLFFSLPEKKKKQGDSWALDLNLIALDQQFICESSERRNIIRLESLKTIKNNIYADISYDITEKVSGDYNERKSELEMKITGFGFFNVSGGYYEELRLDFKVHISGVMSTDTRQLIVMKRL